MSPVTPVTPAESFGTYAARELIAAKAAGQVLTAKPLAAFIDTLLEAYAQPHPEPASVANPATVTAEMIYQAYPRKIGKKAALKAIAAALRSDSELPRQSPHPSYCLLRLTQAYAAAVATWPAKDREFIPHPATWFNRGSYLDDPQEWQSKAARTTIAAQPRDYTVI
jgi:hypothetical protein